VSSPIGREARNWWRWLADDPQQLNANMSAALALAAGLLLAAVALTIGRTAATPR
jgi:hypothetical protein